MTTLITAAEVVRYSNESENFPPQKVANFIFQKEQRLVRTLFGRDFWALLLADKVDYGDVQPWKSSETYASGDYVEYYGLTLKSLVDSNTEEPCEDTDGSNWEVAEKFASACYKTLWNDYLKFYLSWIIMAAAIEHSTYPVGGKGVTVWRDDRTGTASASPEVVNQRKAKLHNDAAEVLENMKAWMYYVYNVLDSNNADYCDFSEVKFLDGCDALPVEHRGRRIMLKNKRVIRIGDY